MTGVVEPAGDILVTYTTPSSLPSQGEDDIQADSVPYGLGLFGDSNLWDSYLFAPPPPPKIDLNLFAEALNTVFPPSQVNTAVKRLQQFFADCKLPTVGFMNEWQVVSDEEIAVEAIVDLLRDCTT